MQQPSLRIFTKMRKKINIVPNEKIKSLEKEIDRSLNEIKEGANAVKQTKSAIKVRRAINKKKP